MKQFLCPDGLPKMAYFPQVPIGSTLHLAEKQREWNNIADQLMSSEIGRYNKFYALAPPRIVAWCMTLKIKNVVNFRSEVRSLSAIIREQGLKRIDLLKIDIEGCELQALKGIEEIHRSLIQQLVMAPWPRIHEDLCNE